MSASRAKATEDSALENFHRFAQSVGKRLDALALRELFVADTVDIWAAYLNAFPPGTNPVFRERTEHDCSCCRNFIRNFGPVVAIVDGRKESLWAIEGLPHPYDTVAAALRELVMQAPVAGVFRSKEAAYGSGPTPDSKILGHRWEHLHGQVRAAHRSLKVAEDCGRINTTAQVFRRGLDELRPEALETVLDLIDANALYRGAEFRAGVVEFQALQRDYRVAPQPDLHVWANLDSRAARLRNTAIGQLLQDLSVDDPDTEGAVRAFERMVAPTNYRRPTALITPKMVDAALATLAGLGLEHAVDRRFARLSDVSVRDMLWVDNDVRPKMRDGLRAALMEAAVQRQPIDLKHATPITIDQFLSEVVPAARSMEVLVKNQHRPNFVSLTAPLSADTGRLFRWKNDFGWSYEGEAADSIKQRVKRAGGNIDAALRVSLAWSNHDDLDIHARCPHGHVYFGNKAGILDVDMNVWNPLSREPVENLSWTAPRDGDYAISVHQYQQREATDVGFSLELECGGEVKRFSHPRGLAYGEEVRCLGFRMKGGVMSDLRVLDPSLVGGDLSAMQWGVRTEALAPVAALMTSPNHWDGAGGAGAKHWIFVLQDCRNPNKVRGLYNEFLRPDLDPHRKVFEVLAAKTKCEPTEDQVSGIGFTAARGHQVVAKVATVSATRAYAISF